MTTPTPPVTAVTDPDNVMWIVETPPPAASEETVASARRGPKMTAYRALLASLTAATDPNFKETNVKRDSKGRFAKKAGVKAAAPTPVRGEQVPGAAPGVHVNDTVALTGGQIGRILSHKKGKFGLDSVIVELPDGTQEEHFASDVHKMTAAQRKQFADAPTLGTSVVLPNGLVGNVVSYPTFNAGTGAVEVVVTPEGSSSSEKEKVTDLTLGSTEGTVSPLFTSRAAQKAAAAKKTAPAKKTAAAPAAAATPTTPATSIASTGKKMTNKVIYGKHANGTIIESTDGQHRMIYNAAANNWTIQERTPDGGWTTTGIFGKGAAYKKAQELSSSWGDPDESGSSTATSTAAPPAPDPSGPFAPGWDDLSGVNISPANHDKLLSDFMQQNVSPNVHPGLLTQSVSNLAQTYGIEPQQVLALVEDDFGGTDYTDAVKAYLGTDPFPPPMYPAKKSAKKIPSKKTAAPTPTVAPSPAAATATTPAASTTSAAPTYTATTNPLALAQVGQPFEMSALEQQANDSANITALRQQLITANNSSTFTDAEIKKLMEDYKKARQKYTAKWGVSWSPSHAAALGNTYDKEVAKINAAAAAAAGPQPGDPIPGAAGNVTVGTLVELHNGNVGTALGAGPPNAAGVPTVNVQLPDGSTVATPVGHTYKLKSTKAQDDFANVPDIGVSITTSDGTTGIVASNPTIMGGSLWVKITTPSGSVKTVPVSGILPPGALPPPTFNVGDQVMTPNGPGTIKYTFPGLNSFEVVHPDGKISYVKGDDISPAAPGVVPSSTAPGKMPSGSNILSTGTLVATPMGDGTIVGVDVASDSYTVKMPSGFQYTVYSSDASEIGPSSPPTPPATPAPAPTMSYDPNGVPILSSTDQALVAAQFQSAGVSWYNSSEALFDAAYAASQATGMSVEDVLKYADANFHNSAKDGGKPIQTKVAKWAKSSKGKAHIAATLGTSTGVPATAINPPGTTTSTAPIPGSPTITPSVAPTPASSSGSIPAGDADFSGVPAITQQVAYSLFTAGVTSLSSTPESLAQKASNVAKQKGITPAQVLAIVDAKKAEDAGVPNGNLFTNKVMNHLGGKDFPPPKAPASSTGVPLSTAKLGTPPFPLTPGYATLNASEATQMQNTMNATHGAWTSSQRSSMRTYSGSAYGGINRCLRKIAGCTAAQKQHGKMVTSAMRPTPQNVTVFRGTGFKEFGVSSFDELEALVGTTRTDPGIISTSIQPGSAFGGQVAIQIDVPAGSPGAYIQSISQHPSEQEFLLPPGTKFRVIEVTQGPGGKAHVRVEVVNA